MTTERFIRFGPAAISPRSPAVPKTRGPENRSSRSASAAASPASASARMLVSDVAVSSSGSSAIQARTVSASNPCVKRSATRSVEALMSQSFPTMSASGREIRGAAAPASMTSAWESGVSWMPAARFVTSEMPMSSSPA